MEKIPLVVIRGLRLEVNRMPVLLLLAPMFKAAAKSSEEAKLISFRIMDQILKLQNGYRIIVCVEKPDQTIAVFGNDEMTEEIRSRTITASQFENIPIYQDDLN
jgi:hypothetical protein